MISVIVPVYNVKDYLRRCVESLLHQDTDQEYEIILVDDGSTDGSDVICDEYQSTDDRVRVIHKTNGGLSSARNEGIRSSKGEWICFVDSDDYVSSRYLTVLDNLRKKFDADMSVISLKKTLENEEIKEHINRFEDFVLDKKAAFYEIYAGKYFLWYAYGKMYPRKVFEKHLFPDGYYEDSASQYLFLDECEKIAFGDYMAEYHYLDRQGSITTAKLTEKHYRIFDVCDEIGQYIDQQYPEWDYVKTLIYQNAVLQLINRLQMTKAQYNEVFYRYRALFRKNVWTILKKGDVSPGLKYNAVVLCLSPRFYKMQRRAMLSLIGDRR